MRYEGRQYALARFCGACGGHIYTPHIHTDTQRSSPRPKGAPEGAAAFLAAAPGGCARVDSACII
jgi:hypothetical protein